MKPEKIHSPSLAEEQYKLAREQFVRVGLGLAAVREFPPGTTTRADIDSGPVLFGLGPSASGFAIATAALMNDDETALALLRAVALLGQPTLLDDGLQYQAMPTVGQAVILFGKTILLQPRN